jgi:hypothetical protein
MLVSFSAALASRPVERALTGQLQPVAEKLVNQVYESDIFREAPRAGAIPMLYSFLGP